MEFTSLHRALGASPGPLTDDLLDRAVSASVAESTDLDWKSMLPPTRGLPQTDFPKDVAAMANSGGGLIVFGVSENDKRATERVDVGNFDENYERSLRSAAITAISPPVFGLVIHRLGDEGSRAVIVEVPASMDGPHLIYRNELFGAPVRNDADTVWMKERQIEAMYRLRLDERRRSTEELAALYADAASGRDSTERSWLVAVARPRIPRVAIRLKRDDARDAIRNAGKLALVYASRSGIHPLESVDRDNPRPGLRRWVAANAATKESSRWKESWISIHDDGAITLTTHIGGHRRSDGYHDERQIESAAIECAIADLMALVRTVAETFGHQEYEVQVGIEWGGSEPLLLLTTDQNGYTYDGGSVPLHRYTPVRCTVDAAGTPLDYYWRVHDLAQDCVNQGGIEHVRLIQPPARPDTTP